MKLMLGTAVAAAALLLSACGSTSGGEASGGSWTYTDGRGEKITLDETPTRVVAQSSIAAALNDLGVDVVGVFGPLTLPDGSVDPQAAGLDPDEVVDVTGGGAYGTLDLEKLAEVKPDLVVTNMYLKPELWFLDADTAAKVEKLAPIAALDFQDKTLVETLDVVESLGAELGADLDAAEAVEGREAFDAASARLTAVGEKLAADDQDVLAMSATADLFYAADPSKFPDVTYYESIGVPIVPVKATGTSYWDELSWENADRYPASIVIWDSRIGQAGLDAALDQPAFAAVPAVADEKLVPWAAVTPPGYAAYASVVEALADGLEAQL